MAYSSYYKYQKYIKYHAQDPLPNLPTTYSVDGEETMPLIIKEECDPNCGCTGGTETLYRWTNIDPSLDWICDECPQCMNNEIYTSIRYAVVGTICLNGDKYERLRQYTKVDQCINGVIVEGEWEESDPSLDTYGNLLEMDSPDCQ